MCLCVRNEVLDLLIQNRSLSNYVMVKELHLDLVKFKKNSWIVKATFEHLLQIVDPPLRKRHKLQNSTKTCFFSCVNTNHQNKSWQETVVTCNHSIKEQFSYGMVSQNYHTSWNQLRECAALSHTTYSKRSFL